MGRSTFLVGFVLLVGGAALIHTVVRLKAEQWNRQLRACLGGSPLQDGESGIVRLRRIEVAQRSLVGTTPESWPARCADLTSRVATSRFIRWRNPALTGRAREAESDVRAGHVSDKVAALLEATHSLDGGLDDEEEHPTSDPPWTPALDARTEQVRRRCVGRPALAPADKDTQPVRGFVYETEETSAEQICQVDEEGEARCEPRPPALAWAQRVSSGDPERVTYAGRGAILSRQGEELATKIDGNPGASAVFLIEPGAVAWLSRDRTATPELVWSKAGAETRSPVAGKAILAAGHLLWASGGKLRARALRGEAPGLGPERELGPATEGELDNVRTCRSRGGWAVVLSKRSLPSSLRTTSLPEPQTLQIYQVDDEGWSGPHAIELESPRTEVAETLGTWTLSCGPGMAQVGWSRSFLSDDRDRHELSVARCTRHGCELQRTTVWKLGVPRWNFGSNHSPRPNGLEAPAVVPLGDSVALLWLDHPFFFARIAPLAELNDASRIALVQRSEFEQNDTPGPRVVPYYSSLQEVVAHGDSALLLLHSSSTRQAHFYPFWLSTRVVRALDCGR